ncbi:MAG: exonuclease SbcC [Gammaproteobacteria bacterium]|nr:exonuclease SbcC [Gammaproteobacteria bacterium]
MRILAIRGHNLASLAGDFEIQFQREPLHSAGLFAICGPTGAGKSTLLDALCLALYDQTPRLNRAAAKGVSLPDVGEESITPQDPRNLLRRGAGEGSAEVDFIGNDGVSYRAHWSVRRARGKPGGRLQNTEMWLQPLAGDQRIGGVKSEVLQAIEARLGLSFSQFTRAVLLAQNEFAVFLKSNDNERAELLETLTGLEIYTAISKRAFERSKAEHQRLEAVQTQLAGQQPLSAEARAELDRLRVAATDRTFGLEQRKSELERQLQWHETWQALQLGEAQAQASVEQASAALAGATPRRTRLARVESVQVARPLIETLDRLAAESARARGSCQEAERQLETATARWQEAESQRAGAEQTLTAAEQCLADAADTLAQARGLETAIATLAPGHAQATSDLEEARRAAAEAGQRLAEHAQERQDLARDLRERDEWLIRHQSSRPLAADWPRWDQLLADAAGLHSGLREAEQGVATAQQDEQQARLALEQASRRSVETAAALQEAEQHLRAAQAELAACAIDQLAEGRERAQARADRLADAERLWSGLVLTRTRQDQLADERRGLQEQLVQAESALEGASQDQPILSARLAQAEQSLRIAEAASGASVEHLRAGLQPGAPCPVCGALDHPYTAGDAPTQTMLVALASERDACRTQLQDLIARAAAEQAGRTHRLQRLAELAREQEQLSAALAREQGAWDAHPLAAELAAIPDAERQPWFSERRQAIREALEAIAAQELAQRQAARQRDTAQGVRDQSQIGHADSQAVQNRAQANHERALRLLQSARERHTELAGQLAERLDALDGAFVDQEWRRSWQADPTGAHEQRREEVRRWNAQVQRAEQIRLRLGILEIAIEGATATAADRSAQLERAAAAYQVSDEQLREKRLRRQSLFDGRPVNEVQAQLITSIETARTALKQQDERLRQAELTRAGAATRLGAAQQALGEREQALADARLALHDWLADLETREPAWALDETELRALLVHDGVWIKTEQEAIQSLRDALDRARTILEERQAQRRAHEQVRASQDSLESLRESHVQTLAELEQSRSQATEAELQVRQDDERRLKAAALQAELLRQEASARLWGQLNELIGSADGKKLRNHAQQLTLEVLLGYANRHLDDLSRRYRLERVKDTLALMVVDQDMGDEIRSVHSLSGGESFLVSLALALGLASLSSHRVPVESLFIDEGFGSLDAETLRVAMDALDNLQAQGRKVGVISHVQEMTERIGVRIQVRRQFGGQSRIEVTPAAAREA